MKYFRYLFIALAISIVATAAADARGGDHSSGSSHYSSGEHYTHGYTRRDGTYVEGYHATNPNGTRNDNFSTRGNMNPYTGEPGTKPRDEDAVGRLR